MAKKSPASSRRAGLVSMKSDDIKSRKWSNGERKTFRSYAAKQAAGDDSGINFEDIPPLTEAQLAQMVRLRDIRPKVPVSVRLDPQVLTWLKSKGGGHLTRINDILKTIMEADERAHPSIKPAGVDRAARVSPKQRQKRGAPKRGSRQQRGTPAPA